MAKMGMGGFFMHTRVGLITPYLSKEYLECHQVCIDEAKKLGMAHGSTTRTVIPAQMPEAWSPGKGDIFQAKGIVLTKVIGGKSEPNSGTVAVFKYNGEGDNITSFQRVPTDTLKDPSAGNLLHCYWKAGGYADVMSKPAVAAFIDCTHDVFANAFSSDFGKTIPGIFTDEPHLYAPRLPWTVIFVDEFRKRMGYDIRDHIPSLYYQTAITARSGTTTGAS